MEYATPEPAVAPQPEVEVEVEAEYVDAVEQPVQEEAATDLRSELANLFGMGADSEAETPVEDLVDVGTEGGDSIVLSFKDTQGVLLEAQQEDSAPEEADEGHDGDYVTRYMEQLLERSRTSADELLPEELNKVEVAAPQPAKPTSFIDQYAQGDPDESSEAGGEVPASDGYDAALLDVPSSARQKIYLEALRQDMDSFRQVSARSVQKALETHAMRKERNGMAGRQAVTGVLASMTVLVAIANVMGLIAFPKLVWGLTVASVLAAGELFRRMYIVKSRLCEMTDHVGPAPDATTAPAEQPDVGVEGEEAVGEDFIGPIAEKVTEMEVVVSEAIIPEELPTPGEDVAPESATATVLGATDEEEEKYYEL